MIALAFTGCEFGLNVNDRLRSIALLHSPPLFRLMQFLSFNDGMDGILGILLAQGIHADVLLEIGVNEGEALSAFYRKSVLGKERKKRIEVVRFLLQRFVYGNSQPISV